MTKYERLKRYYEKGLWNKEMIRNAVIKKWLTEEEYKEITGEDYV